MTFIVTIKEVGEGLMAVTIVKDYEELKNLILHLDREVYDIVEISGIQMPVLDSKEFYKTDVELEKGETNA